MSHKIRDIGVSDQNWKYRDPVEVRPNLRWLFTSGTPGLELRGTLPADITGQTNSLGNIYSACSSRRTWISLTS